MARKKESLESKVIQSIRKQSLISAVDTLIIAVSGGADSVCLLHILVKWQAELNVKLHVAHLNHQLRGEESEADARYVSNLAFSLGIPATIERRDIAAYKNQKRCSPEEAAREVRYSFLAEVAKTENASCVVVGHTRDDHVETILMHLLRGTGTAGLRGLQPRALLQVGEDKTRLNIIRPLLDVLREETVDYCRRFQLNPRKDSSNVSYAFLRNRVRLELLPVLKNYNPKIDAALLRLAAIVDGDVSLIEEQASHIWDEVAQKENSAIYLDADRMLRFPLAMQRQIFRMAVARLLGDIKDIEADHIEAMVDFLSKPAGKRLCLPNGLRLHTEYGRLVLTIACVSLCPFPVLEDKFNINVPGETALPGWLVETVTSHEPVTDDRNEFTASFDLEKVGTNLAVRRRKQGDRFQPLGMSQSKKLQDFMVDAKIPRSWRSLVPLLCSPEQILWVVGWRIDDRAKVTKATKRILNVKFTRLH